MKMMNLIVTSLLMIILFSNLLFADQQSNEILAKLHRMAEQGQIDSHQLERFLRQYDLEDYDFETSDILRDLKSRVPADDWELYVRYIDEMTKQYENPMFLSEQRSSPFDRYTESTIAIILEEFQVNENAGKSDKNHPCVVADGSGNFVVVWEDYRNMNPDIYAQRYDSSGQALGDKFLVNDDGGFSEQEFPLIAMNDSGNFIITWRDERNHYYYRDIYAQLYSSSGEPLGDNIRVTEVGTFWLSGPSAVMDNNGNFIITWKDDRNDNDDIFAQRYNSSGEARGDNFLVNDDEVTSDQYGTSVAINDSGNCIIIWLDERDGGSNGYIYAQLYDSNGQALGNNFLVSDEEGYDWHGNLSVAMDDSGNFVIIWEGESNEYIDVYMQLFNNNGQPRGEKTLVYTDENREGRLNYPSVAMDQIGNFIITWQVIYRYDKIYNSVIYAKQYDRSGEELGTSFVVNESNSWIFYPSIAIGKTGNVIITWEDYRNDFHDIYAQLYNSSGQPQGGNFAVTLDDGSGLQKDPSIAINSSGNFVIAWEDERNGYSGDIYAQLYNSSGQARGGNFLVNDFETYTSQYDPSVAMDDSGNFVVIWTDSRNDYNENIFAQLYNSSGQIRGDNFPVGSVQDSIGRDSPAVAMNSSGDFVVTWREYNRYVGGFYIYAQHFNSSGQAQGGAFLVNDDDNSHDAKRTPSVAIDDSGNFVIAWDDDRNGDWSDIYAQGYNSEGQPLGINFQVNDEPGDHSDSPPSVAINDSGSFIITWRKGYNNEATRDIYAQLYKSIGQAQGKNFLVNDAIDGKEQNSPSVSMDSSGNYIIIWVDERNGNREIYAQRFDKEGKIDQNFRLHPYNRYISYSDHDVVLLNNKVIITWADYIVRGQGYDVLAKMYEFKEPVTVVDEPGQQIDSFELLNCYPNPFNMSTSIDFNVATAADVTLDIFNIRGQKINELFSGFKNAGKHRLVWDATDQYGAQVSSGIYLVEIRAAGFRKVQKVVLVK